MLKQEFLINRVHHYYYYNYAEETSPQGSIMNPSRVIYLNTNNTTCCSLNYPREHRLVCLQDWKIFKKKREHNDVRCDRLSMHVVVKHQTVPTCLWFKYFTSGMSFRRGQWISKYAYVPPTVECEGNNQFMEFNIVKHHRNIEQGGIQRWT